MAGWKLRKDKSQGGTETAGTEPQDEALSGVAAPASQEAAPDFETDNGLHFEEDDGPLTLVDYTEPDTQPLIAAPPPPDMIPPEPESVVASKDFTSTMRMNREELSGAFAPPPQTSLPTVPPFVLDTPLVTEADEDTPPRLVVRVGRLSGAFELTKDVTTIGRPDSSLQYYPDVEIDLDDAVSRRHAEVIRREDSYSLVDTGSANGTLLNGEKLPPHEERLLAHGDRIRVGERTEIIFE